MNTVWIVTTDTLRYDDEGFYKDDRVEPTFVSVHGTEQAAKASAFDALKSLLSEYAADPDRDGGAAPEVYIKEHPLT